jgi:hypothetical protein
MSAAKQIAAELNVQAVRLGADTHNAVDEACIALSRHGSIYQREGRLVQPIKIADRVSWAREGEGGVPTLREVPIATLACELTRVAVFERFDGRSKTWVPCEPPDRLVAAVSQSTRWPGVRPLHGIVEAPVMRADGSILQDRGYDAATGLIYEPSGAFPSIPDAPTLEDAQDAMLDLMAPFEEFPFATDADRLVPIAVVLTSLAMGALEGANVPCFLFDANVQGTGKTLCGDACSWILTGREIPKQTFPGEDKAELEKILSGAALAATQMLMLDNINVTFGGDAIEQRMTCRGRSQFRLLGGNKIVNLPWRTIVLASGNNVRTTVDMRRRAIRCRLVATQENPEERPIKRKEPLRDFIVAARQRLVAAGLTILRAYVAAGRPKQQLGAMGNFEEWSALVGGALKWVTDVDVLEARMPSAAAIDPVTEAYAAFLSEFSDDPKAVWKLGAEYTAKDFVSMTCWNDLISFDDRNRALRVAGIIRQMNERPVDGRQIIPASTNKHQKLRKYKVVQV